MNTSDMVMIFILAFLYVSFVGAYLVAWAKFPDKEITKEKYQELEEMIDKFPKLRRKIMNKNIIKNSLFWKIQKKHNKLVHKNVKTSLFEGKQSESTKT